MQLRAYIKKHKISQAAFGRLIGAGRNTVSRYVAGEQIPEKEYMMRIMKETGGKVMPNDFYTMKK